MSKKIIIVAGPNGAGKTTFARSFLPENAYKPEVDTWAKYDNVGESPTLLEWGESE